MQTEKRTSKVAILKLLAIVLIGVVCLTGCESMSTTERGAAIGGCGGAAIGGVLGGWPGALIGGAAGAATGAGIGAAKENADAKREEKEHAK